MIPVYNALSDLKEYAYGWGDCHVCRATNTEIVLFKIVNGPAQATSEIEICKNCMYKMSNQHHPKKGDLRQLQDHKTNDINRQIEIYDYPLQTKPRYKVELPDGKAWLFEFHQADGIARANGLTNEVLLAIVLDRLKGFQETPFKCDENELALVRIAEALFWLQSRTTSRLSRGVEGKLVP